MHHRCRTQGYRGPIILLFFYSWENTSAFFTVLCTYLVERHSETWTEKEISTTASSPKDSNSWVWVRLKSNKNSIQVSYFGSRNPTTWTMTCCLQRSAYAGSWNQEWNWDSNPDTLKWDASIYSIKSTRLHAQPWVLLTVLLNFRIREVFNYSN